MSQASAEAKSGNNENEFNSAEEAIGRFKGMEDWKDTTDYGGPRSTHKLDEEGNWIETTADGKEVNKTESKSGLDLIEHKKIIDDLLTKKFAVVIKESSQVLSGTEVASMDYEQKIHATVYNLNYDNSIGMTMFEGTIKEFQEQFFDYAWQEDSLDDNDSYNLDKDSYNNSGSENSLQPTLSKKETTKSHEQKNSFWQNFWTELSKQLQTAERESKILYQNENNFFNLFTPLSPALEVASQGMADQEVSNMTFDLFPPNAQTESFTDSFVPNSPTEFSSSIISLDRAIRESDSQTEVNEFEQAIISIQNTPEITQPQDNPTQTDKLNFESISDGAPEAPSEVIEGQNNFKTETLSPVLKEITTIAPILTQEATRTNQSEPRKQTTPIDKLPEIKLVESVIRIQATINTEQSQPKEVVNMPPVEKPDVESVTETAIVKNYAQFTESLIPDDIENQPKIVEAPVMPNEAQIETKAVTQESRQVINIVETAPQKFEKVEPVTKIIKNEYEKSVTQETEETDEPIIANTITQELTPIVIPEKTTDILQTAEVDNTNELLETLSGTETPSIYTPVIETAQQAEPEAETIETGRDDIEETIKPQQIQKVQTNNRPTLKKASFERFNEQTKAEQVKTTETNEITEPKVALNIELVEKTTIKQTSAKPEVPKTNIIEKNTQSLVKEPVPSKVLERRADEVATYSRFEQTLKALEKITAPETSISTTQTAKPIPEQKTTQKETAKLVEPIRYVQFAREAKAVTFNEMVSIVRQINEESQPATRFREVKLETKKKRCLDIKLRLKDPRLLPHIA